MSAVRHPDTSRGPSGPPMGVAKVFSTTVLECGRHFCDSHLISGIKCGGGICQTYIYTSSCAEPTPESVIFTIYHVSIQLSIQYNVRMTTYNNSNANKKNDSMSINQDTWKVLAGEYLRPTLVV
jgi:hypothetical protein